MNYCEELPLVKSPPLFSELGSRTRKLFNDNYFFGVMNLYYRAYSHQNIVIEAIGVKNLETTKMACFFDGKVRAMGVTINERWSTQNVLECLFTTGDIFARGLTSEIDILYSPHTGKKAGLLSLFYRTTYYNCMVNFKNEYGASTAAVSTMVTMCNWLGGCQFTFDMTNKVFSEANFAIGYHTEEFNLNTIVKQCGEFSGSVYNRVNERLESGFQVTWSSGYSIPRFGLGCVFQLDSNTSFSTKINNLTQLGLSFSHAICPYVTLTGCALLDGRTMDQGGHKVGFGIRFDNLMYRPKQAYEIDE